MQIHLIEDQRVKRELYGDIEREEYNREEEQGNAV